MGFDAGADRPGTAVGFLGGNRCSAVTYDSDQGLLLASLAGIGVVLSLMFWSVLPVTTPHPHECCKKPELQAEPVFKPAEALNKNAQRLALLTAQIESMEQRKAEANGQNEKGKGKAEGGTAEDSSAKTKP